VTITILCAGALARPHSAAPDFGPETGAPLHFPLEVAAFSRAFRRARVAARRRQAALLPDELPDEAWLRERFALEGAVAACALPARGAQVPDLLVRPVHLHLAPDHVVLAPPHALDVGRDEAEVLAARANALLVDEGLRLHVAEPALWRLEALDAQRGAADLAGLAQLLARSARMAAGRNIDAYLPSGPAARRWRQLANLVQMAWFDHPLNAAREAEGRPTINALWLEGRAGVARARPFARVVTADPTVAGLAQRAGAEARLVATGDTDGVPADGWSQWIDSIAAEARAPEGTLLLAPDFWRAAISEGDLEGWAHAWRAFDRWFEALQAASPRLLAGELRLVMTGERSTVELLRAPADRWKAWRRLRVEPLLAGDA